MARKLRIEYAGATYHVMARGNQGRDIYAEDRDRKLWLQTLGEACEKTGWRIHAWVMMGNHYHLLLETPEPNLVAGMKWFQGTYTQRYNCRHGLMGHLYQGRYKALVVEGTQGSCLAVVSTYIHLNPARAGLIGIGREPLACYRWSSYPLYLKGPAERPGWLVTERVLGSLGLGPGNRRGYRAYLEGRVLELGIEQGREKLAEEWKGIRRGWYLGGAEFRERMLGRVGSPLLKGGSSSHGGEARREHGEAQAERLLQAGLPVMRLEESQLEERPKGAAEKQALAWWLCRHTTVRRRWVTQRLGMGDESRVTQAIRRVESGVEPNWRGSRSSWKRDTRAARRQRHEYSEFRDRYLCEFRIPGPTPAMGWFVNRNVRFSFFFSFFSAAEVECCVASWIASSGGAPVVGPGLTCYPYILCGVHYIVSNPARGAHGDQSLNRAIQRPRGQYGLRYAPKVS